MPGWVPAPHWASFHLDKTLWRLTPQVKYTKYNGQYEPQKQARVGHLVRAFASHTKGSLPGWVPVLLWATFQPEKKTSTLNATSEILREKHLKIIGKAEILGGMNSQILFEIENFVEISKSQDLLSFFKRWRCIHSA